MTGSTVAASDVSKLPPSLRVSALRTQITALNDSRKDLMARMEAAIKNKDGNIPELREEMENLNESLNTRHRLISEDLQKLSGRG